MSSSANAAATVLRHVEQCMGTVFSLDVRAPGIDKAALDDTLAWLHWVDATFSTYQPDSEVCRLGCGELELADASPEVGEILRRCTELEDETGGYFSAYAGGELDPSGLVKGWAIEQASARLVAAGAINHTLNGGGDVQCAGSAAPGQPWRIGVADPFDPARVLAVLAGDDLAVATSGTAERGAHVLDPHTRTPASALASVTVAGRHLGTADAFATAAFAMGAAGPDWLAGLSDYRSFVVRSDGSTWASPGFLAQP